MNRKTLARIVVGIAIIMVMALSQSLVLSKPLGGDEALTVAKGWLAANSGSPLLAGGKYQAQGAREFTDSTGNLLAYVVDLSPKGYIVVSADDTIDPILAVGTNGNYTTVTGPFETLSDMLIKDIPSRISKQSSVPQAYKDKVADAWGNLHTAGTQYEANGKAPASAGGAGLTPVVAPMLTETWYQLNEDLSGIPTYNYCTPENCVTGCVATAMGMMIHHFAYPPSASEKDATITVYSTTYFISEPQTVSFSDVYDYSAMPDALDDSSTLAQIKPVSDLLYDCGIAVSMDYTPDESGSYVGISEGPTPISAQWAYTNVFGYASADWEDGMASDWLPTLELELNAGYPVQFAINCSLGGHSIVCDGYATSGTQTFLHLNMGWGGQENGYYAVPGWVTFPYTWDVLDGYVYNIRKPGGTSYTITPTSSPNGSVNPTLAQAVPSGGHLAFTAYPYPGFVVGAWSVDGVVAQTGGTTFALNNIAANHTVGVSFTGPSAGFTITPSAGANGTISPATALQVASGGNATFTATPSTGFMVAGWTVDGVAANTASNTFTLYNVTASHAVQVTFTTLATDTVSVSVSGLGGNVSPTGAQTVNNGGSLLLTASPASGYAVNNWTVDGTVAQTGGNIFTLSDITTDHAVQVAFNTTQQGDWWVFHHDAQHTGLSPFVGPSIPEMKWGFYAQWYVDSSPVIGADGTIYVGSYYLNAINPDGSLKWTSSTSSTTTYDESPTIGPDGTIYIRSDDGNINAFNSADGSSKWTVTNSGGISSPMVGPDGTIYVGSEDCNLYALNPADGTQKWVFATNGAVDSSPAVGVDGTIYVESVDSNLYAINPDGTQKWATPVGNGGESSPAVGADGAVYVGSLDGNVYAVNADGTLRWTFTTGDSVVSSPAIGADGTVYIGSFDGNMYAINTDGTQKWAFQTLGNVYSSPAIGADGTVYFGSDDGVIYAANPDGTGDWAMMTSGVVDSSPAIGPDGTLYIGSEDGNLYAFSNVTSTALVTLTTIAGANGTITPPGTQTVTYGGSVTMTATPNPGFAVKGWTYNGLPIPQSIWVGATAFTGTKYTLRVTTDSLVYVTFGTAQFTLTPVTGVNGVISPNTAQTVNYGSMATFTASPGDGYTVGTWSVDGVPAQTGGASFRLSDVTANHTVSVTFKSTNAVAFTLAGLASNGNIWYTSDLSTWQQVPGSLSSMVIGDFAGNGAYGLAGLASNGSIWYTNDLANWTQIPGQLQSLVAADFSGGSKDGIAGLGTDGSIWYTTDLQTWTKVPGNLSALMAGNFAGTGSCGLAGTASNNSVWYTPDMLTWNNISGESLSTVVPGCFTGNGKDGIAGLDAAGSIWYTSDLATWNSVPGQLSSIVIGDFNGNGDDGIAGLSTDGSIWYTTDLTNWNNIPGNLSSLIVGDFNASGKDGLAGLSSDGSIWYTTDLANWTQIPGQLSTLVSKGK